MDKELSTMSSLLKTDKCSPFNCLHCISYC